MDNVITFDPENRTVEAEKLEALVTDIKATTYSPFQTEEMKVSFIKKAIKDAGY